MPGITPASIEADLTCDRCGGIACDDQSLFHNDRYGGALCEQCNQMYPEQFECSNCGGEWDSENEAHACCRTCESCGYIHSYPEDAYNCCRYSCEQCGETFDVEEDARDCCRGSSEYPALSNSQEVYLLSIPVLPNRPARLCSIEQEITRGGRAAAAMLYDYGFADSSDVHSYTYSPRSGRVGVCEDGSLPSEGGEVIYSRFLLSDESNVRLMSGAVGRMRQLARETDVVRVGKAAGTHIHISATAEDGTRIGPQQMAALHEIFGYAEDFLYGIAAAGWDSHRSPSGTSGYCQAIPKLAYDERRTAFAVSRLMGRDRYYGLNFQRLLSAASNCSCGAARFGEWDACECGTFDSATVEWRLFNASTKPETLHAWLLLSHALTALSMSHPLGTLSVNEYGTTDRDSRKRVQRWIEANAPLSDDEILVIREAAQRSPRLKR